MPIVWGMFLGSGLATWMPYPSFYGTLFAALVLGPLLGTILMGVYGATRAVPGLLAAVSPRLGMDVWASHMLEARLSSHLAIGTAAVAAGSALVVAFTLVGTGF